MEKKSILITSVISIIITLLISIALMKFGIVGQGVMGARSPSGNIQINNNTTPFLLANNNTQIQLGSPTYYIDGSGNANFNQLCIGQVCLTSQQLQKIKTSFGL